MRVSLAQGHTVVAAVAAVLGPASEVESLGLSVTDFAVADWSGPFGIELELHVASTVDAARVAGLLALAEGEPRISDAGTLFWRCLLYTSRCV